MKTPLFRTFALVSLSLTAAHAAPTKVVFWDFFGGGDGDRMKQIVDKFNKSQNDIVVERTTLPWGVPFYTKIHTSVVSGDTPDVITYHLSRMTTGIKNGDFRAITPAEMAEAGIELSQYQQNLVKNETALAKTITGKSDVYGLPLDTHTLVLYYNKDILGKAGLLDSKGQPKAINTLAGFTAALQAIKDKTGMLPASTASSQDPSSVWRIWYTLFLQSGGKLVSGGKLNLKDMDTKGAAALQTMTDWTRGGLIGKNATYPAMVALFSAGRAGFMINGNWEVPTLVDLKKQGKLNFDYGIMPFPKLGNNQQTWADSHMLAIPANAKKPMSKEKLSATLKFMDFVANNSLDWASGGHIPSFLPTQNSAAYKALQPVAQYSARSARNVVPDPALPIFGAAGPFFDALGNSLTPALNGQLTVDAAIDRFKQQLTDLSK